MRPLKIITTFLLIVTAALTGGCKKDNLSQLSFLKVGHQWLYKEVYNSQSDTLTINVTADSSNIYTVVLNGLLGKQTTYWFVNGNYLEYYLVDSTGKKSAASIIYKINAQVGDSWRSVPAGITDSIYSQVSALNVTDTTLNGIYPNMTTVLVYDSTIHTSGAIIKQYWSNDDGIISEQGLFSLNLISRNF